jgi:hypothetical protein
LSLATVAGISREERAKWVMFHLFRSSSDSTVVKHKPHNPRFKGSNPIAIVGTRGDKMAKITTSTAPTAGTDRENKAKNDCKV